MFTLDFFKNKTVLVTGYTGFKGSWLCEILLLSGARVIGYGLEPPTKPNLFSLIGLSNDIVCVKGDVRDFPKVRSTILLYKPEIVIHLAAQPIVLASYKKPRYTFETNVMGTVNVLEAIRVAGCVKSFLNVTTDKVYENNDVPNHRFSEEEKLDGFDPYSNSKSCSELVTHSYERSFFKDSNTRVSTARAGNVIGGGDFAKNRIIPDAVRAIVSNRKIEVRNRLSTRPYQFVLEPLFVYLMIIESQYEDPRFQGCYNVGPDSEDAITTGDLICRFCALWGDGLTWVDRTNAVSFHEAGYLALDNSKLKETFGWSPVYHIDEALSRIVEWTKAWISGDQAGVLNIVDNQIFSFAKEFKK